jgi:hypothetical protein
MGTYDDERSGAYDNYYNKNFYKTTDRTKNIKYTSNEKKADNELIDNETNEPPKVDPKYSAEFISKPKNNFDYTEWKVDDFINNMDKKNESKSVYDKIYFLMEVIHNNIKYDGKLKDFIEKKDSNKQIFKGFYDYKNSAEEVFKNKQGTCVGFSNSLKKLCMESGIKCQEFTYRNYQRNFHHQLNIFYDNGKKYFVDPTWGFIVDDLELLKKIYRGEIPNPRTNINIYPAAEVIQEKTNTVEQETSKPNNKTSKNAKSFMINVFLGGFLGIIILIILFVYWETITDTFVNLFEENIEKLQQQRQEAPLTFKSFEEAVEYRNSHYTDNERWQLNNKFKEDGTSGDVIFDTVQKYINEHLP